MRIYFLLFSSCLLNSCTTFNMLLYSPCQADTCASAYEERRSEGDTLQAISQGAYNPGAINIENPGIVISEKKTAPPVYFLGLSYGFFNYQNNMVLWRIKRPLEKTIYGKILKKGSQKSLPVEVGMNDNYTLGNILVYDNKVEISLPDKYYLSGSIMCDQDSNKVGEFFVFYTTEKSVSFPELYELYKNGGEIHGKETIFYLDGSDTIIKADSVQLSNYKWYYIVEQAEWDGGFEKEYGLVNVYAFIVIEDNRYVYIIFYDEDIQHDKSDYFINFIKTVKIR